MIIRYKFLYTLFVDQKKIYVYNYWENLEQSFCTMMRRYFIEIVEILSS